MGTRVAKPKVEDLLVVRVGMNGIHEAALDAEVLEQDLRERREAVGRAGRVGDDVVLLLIVLVVVDAHDDGDVLVLGGSRDDDLLGAGFQVSLRLVGIGEQAGGLDDDVDAQLAPRQVSRLALGQDLHLDAVGIKTVFGNRHLVECTAVDGVVLQQVCHGRLVAQVVDGDDLELGILRHSAEDQTADTAKSVNAHLCSHTYPFHRMLSNRRVIDGGISIGLIIPQ